MIVLDMVSVIIYSVLRYSSHSISDGKQRQIMPSSLHGLREKYIMGALLPPPKYFFTKIYQNICIFFESLISE